MIITPLDPWIARKIGSTSASLAREQLESFQLQRLQDTVRLAREKSQFYRRHLAQAPRELLGLPDLDRFPFTNAEDIREDPLQFLCVSQDEIHRVVTLDTSGTTGAPKRIYFTKDDQELTIDFFRVGMSTFTDAGDRVLILLPCATPGSVGDLLASALRRLGAQAFKHGPFREEQAVLDLLASERIDGIVGTPTQALALARHPPAKSIAIKSVLVSTDYLSHAIQRAVEQAWGCAVYDHYGMTEMGLGGGVECQARRGCHLREADLYFEIVDPTTGARRPEGQIGEVVFTTLTRRGMPLIRYRTGDLSRFIPGPCPCGTTLRTLERVRNRVSGFVRLADGGRFSMPDLDEALFPIQGLIDFTAILRRFEARDQLDIRARTAPGAQQGIAASINAALDAVPAIRQAKAARTLETQAAVSDPRAGLSPQMGKRRIIDERGLDTSQPSS